MIDGAGRVLPRGDAYGMKEVVWLEVFDQKSGGAGAQRFETYSSKPSGEAWATCGGVGR